VGLAAGRNSISPTSSRSTGRYDPSLPLAFKIAELFGLAIEDIFVSPSKEQ
jgi:DNA-binding XRE family transcriptional regulator